MKYNFLFTMTFGLFSLTLMSCDTLLSMNAGGVGPVVASGEVYEAGYDGHYGRIAYDEARREAFFLSDKMAYELGLTDAQYEAVYEINLDYLLNMQGEGSLYGNYWTRRNNDLFYVLDAQQYSYFIGEDYFYRPVYWSNNRYAYRVYNRYSDRNYYYRSRPSDYSTYRGGRNRQSESYYAGRFGHRSGQPVVTNCAGSANRAYQYDNSRNGAKHNYQQPQQRHYSFGKATRNNAGTVRRTDDRSFDGSRQGSAQQRQSVSPSRSSTAYSPVPQRTSGSRTSFGNASRSSVSGQRTGVNRTQNPTSSVPVRTNMPSNSGSFGGHR
ncbi:MAG: hypothetical protein K6A82_05680 [Prevotella sp.]|nr:hypothetical protein [Prevotella sp.]